MAVEIPVVIDIDKAFAEAASKVPKAIGPLMRQIDAAKLDVQINVGTPKRAVLKSFRDILTDSSTSATQLSRAISVVNKEISALQKAGGFNAASGLKPAERELLALRAALETKLKAGNFIDNATANVRELAMESRAAGQSASRAISSVNAGLRTQQGLFGRLKGYLSVYTAAFAGLRLIRNIRETTAEFELQKVALGGIIQDTTRAKQLFAEIKAAAVESPFEIKDLVSYTKQLSAYRIETDKLFGVTKRLADISAGLGVDMSRLVLAYGQVRAASVLRGQELRQFTEAGVPLVELLAKKFSALRGEMVSTGEVFELISERAVPFAMIEEIFNDMTDAGGIFYQMQLKQSETLKGQWMKLKDVISIAYDEMGRSAMVNDAMRGWISGIQTVVKNWEKVAQVANVAVYSFIAYRLAVKNLIPVYNLQQKAVARQIQIEKRQQIEAVRMESTTKRLTAEEKARIAVIKKMTAEDYKRILATDQMTQKQAMLTFWRNKDNKEISAAIAQTGILTKAQMTAIAKMNGLQVRLKAWGTSIRTFFTNVGSAIAAFWPIAVVSAAITTIMSLISAHKEQVSAIERVDKAYHEQEQTLLTIENAYKRIQQAIESVAEGEDRATKAAESFSQKLEYAQKIVEMLQKYGVGGDFDLTLLDVDTIDEFVENWLKQLNEANDLTRDWGRAVAETLTAAEGPLHILGDNLKTDIAQLNSAYVKMTSNKKFREGVQDMRNYLESLEITYKGHYDLLSLALGMDAKLAVAQKRRNETEYQYQIRLIENYEKIRKFAQSDRFMLNGAMKFFEPMNDALLKFNERLDEVEREFDKTWGALEGKDELTIKMAIDKLFAENEWEDWLKDAWIERINGKYNMNIQVTPTVANVNVPKGMKGILATEFENLFTPQELENMNTVSEIGAAIDEKMKSAAQALQDADREANNLVNNQLWAEQTKEKIKKAQIVIDEELRKDEKDRNEDAINENIALIDALTRQNEVYEKQIENKKESAKAEYELAKAAKERLLNENLSLMAQDIQKTFPELVAGEDIIDKMNLQKIGEAIQNLFPDASADLLARPLVDAAELVKKGWEEAGEGIATVYSSSFDYEDETGKHNILVTPILPDGSVLSPEELDEYIDELLSRGGDLREIDSKKLILGIDVPEDAGERLHELQEEYYALQEQVKNTAKRFLITDEDLLKIKDGVDAYDVWAKNMKAIADEREKMEGAGVDELIVAEEQMKLDAERIAIEAQLADIEKQIVDWDYEEAKAQYESLKLAVEQATTAASRAEAQAELKKFLDATNFDERAILVIEKQRLTTQLGITNAALGAKTAILDTFATLDMAEKYWEEFGKRYNFTLKEKPKGGGSEQDPWIMLFKNRMKFMQDFQKGVEDLDNYLTHSISLGREQEVMKGRGLSLGIKTDELLGTPQELRDWYDKAIKEVVAKIRSMGGKEFAGMGVTEILAKDLTGRKIQKYQELLQELWKGLTDFDTSQIKKDLDDAMEKLTADIKRSQTARDFYQSIFDLTGDEGVATTLSMSVYGDIGKDFKDRMQQQLEDALNTLDWSALDDVTFGNLSFATITGDLETMLQYIDLFPPKYQEMLKKLAEDNEKLNANWYQDFIKTFQKAKTYEERINTLQAQKQAKIEEARSKPGITESDINSIVAYYDKKIAEVQLEALKDTYTWTKAFEDLNGVSDQTLRNLITLIDEYIELYGQDLEPQQLKELTRSRENAKQQLISRNAYKATSKAVKDLIVSSQKLKTIQEEGKENTEEGAQAADEQREALERLRQSLDKIYNDMDAVVSKTKELMDVFASDDDSAYFGEQLDNMSKALKGAGTAAVGIAQLLSGAITPQAIMETATGLADVVSGIFGGVNAKQVRDANKEYDKQAKLLKNLDRAYNQLEKSIGEAFGNDYVYRFSQQLEILQAQYDAYIAQAENREDAARKESTKKNRKRYEEEAEEARALAMDTQHAMDSLRYEASQNFAGADLASAAESFADAWLSAYEEFGDTSTAIEERMTEMVQTLMKKAALSGIAQNILGNWYSSLADVKDWNAQTIAEKWKEAMALVNPMVEGMQVFANSMQAEGVSLRNTVGQFTGISRDIAGASEESINGLASGINTQNYYMSFMPMISENVAQILTYMTGGNAVTPTAQTGVEGMPSVQTIVYNNLPAIRSDIGDLLQLMKSVISVGNVAPRNYVAIK